MQRSSRLIYLLFGPAVFLSAFLLFLIQPLFAKLILPWFGGSGSVWSTCLVFFQVALLGGYLYAFLLVRYARPGVQAAIHTVLLGCALAVLPVIPGPQWKPGMGDAPLPRLLLLLTAVLGLPFFLLSSTGPLLQAWIARRTQGAAPYRLFAVSNAAALLALVVYPVWIEPRFSARAQDVAWSAGFGVFAILAAAAGWLSRAEVVRTPVGPRPGRRSLAIWFALSAGGSMLLLSTTNQLTQNVAAVPFLWILPLAVYLMTFILCFEGRNWYRRGAFLRIAGIAFAAVAYMIYDIQLSAAIFVAVPVLLAGLFAGCMWCHGELSLRKPEGSQLTSFYLMIAAGGATGAVAIGLIAPLLFSGVYELAFSLLLIAALAAVMQDSWSPRLLWATLAVAMAFAFGAQVIEYHRHASVLTRDFYGTLRVVDSTDVRRLYHGTIEHGAEFLDPAKSAWPTTYYGRESGIGLALAACCGGGARNVGVIGLGTGTLAAYGNAGDRFRFYEIDPAVLKLARSSFRFLAESRAGTSFALGDARLTLEREQPQNFDVLAIDAFSGDAIPVHLLTSEAFALYRRHLKPSGILAVHVSNQYLDLAPVVAQAAAGIGMRAVAIANDADPSREIAAATWVLASCDPDFFARGEIAKVSRPVAARAGLRPWTDDYNDLFEAIRWLR
jgi:SAM-dependent methyltransferase